MRKLHTPDLKTRIKGPITAPQCTCMNVVNCYQSHQLKVSINPTLYAHEKKQLPTEVPGCICFSFLLIVCTFGREELAIGVSCILLHIQVKFSS